MKAVVLLSGGVDSTVALAQALPTHDVVRAVTFDYQQTHRREIGAASRIAEHYNVPHSVISLPVFGGSALTSDQDIPVGHAEHVDATYVPARNIVFLSVGAAIAESLGAALLIYGANRDDQAGYPDCRPGFVTAVNELLQKSMAKPVWVCAPFINTTKQQIRELGANLGAPLHLTWSCYRGGDQPCGQCGACA